LVESVARRGESFRPVSLVVSSDWSPNDAVDHATLHEGETRMYRVTGEMDTDVGEKDS